MRVEIDQMPNQARLWVFQADRKLTSEEMYLVRDKADQFINSWAAHGQTLMAGYDIKYDQFLVIAVDESHNAASGCSIDDCVRLVKTLEEDLNISFLDRSKIAFLIEDNVILRPMQGLKLAVEQGEITGDMLVVNNSISSYKDFKESWIQTASDSWLKRYFNN